MSNIVHHFATGFYSAVIWFYWYLINYVILSQCFHPLYFYLEAFVYYECRFPEKYIFMHCASERLIQINSDTLIKFHWSRFSLFEGLSVFFLSEMFATSECRFPVTFAESFDILSLLANRDWPINLKVVFTLLRLIWM